MKIELGKEYQTRDGREVRIYAVDGGDSPRVVHGAQLAPELGWLPRSWDINGIFDPVHGHSIHDLVEKPKTVEVDFWVNVYSKLDGENKLTGYSFASKEQALQESDYVGKRIACINIKRTVTEGEGL
jgi:hypothetical protein